MPRAPRVHYEGAIYHLIGRGVGKRDIFLDAQDYAFFLDTLEAVKVQVPFLLHAFCLMPNHFHLLLQVVQDTTQAVMQKLLTRYAVRFKRRYGWVGHVFQGRYKAILCEKETYFMELLRYIHLNPVRAGLTKGPAEWAWSGHRDLVGMTDSSLLDLSLSLPVFHEDLAKARLRYGTFVMDGINMGHRADFYPPAGKPYLGSPEFIARMQVMAGA